MTPAVDNVSLSDCAESYEWSFPGSPLRIRLNLDVVTRLNADLDITYGEAGTPFALSAGVLLGCVDGDGHGVRQILGYQFTENGQGYFAPPEGEGGAWEEASSGSIVGFFCTQAGESGVVAAETRAFINRFVHPPVDVVMLIRSDPAGRRVAGFLFRDGEEITPFSFLDFPLDTESLRAEIASKRAVARRIGVSADSSISRSGPTAQASDQPLAAAPGPPAATKAATRALPRWWKGGLIIGSMAMCALAVTVGLVLIQRPLASKSKPDQPVQSPVREPSPFGLEVEARGNGLNLRWNAGAIPIHRAVSGRLLVTEQGVPDRVVDLTPEQLRIGWIFYVPSSDRVQFHFEVLDAEEHPTGEAVLALRSVSLVRTVPLSPPAPQRTAVVPDPSASTQSASVKGPNKVFDASSVATLPGGRPHAENLQPLESPELPPVPLGFASGILPAGATQIPAAPISVSEPLPSPAQDARPIRVTSSPNRPQPVVQKPVALRKAMPRLDSNMWRLLSTDKTVEVRVHIDVKGAVLQADVVRLLRIPSIDQAVLNAARLWTFQPASVEGRPVESDHLIEFRLVKPKL